MLVPGFVGWLTEYKIDVFVLCFLPVSLAAWFLGMEASIGLAVLSAVMWSGPDILSVNACSQGYAVWNTVIRLGAFLAAGWSVFRLRRLIDRERETAGVLRRSLSESKGLAAFLPICAQCKKIRNKEGIWQHPEVYIARHSNIQFSHGYCPECAEKARVEAGLVEKNCGCKAS